MTDPAQAGGYVVAFLIGCDAAYQRYRSHKQSKKHDENKEAISDAQAQAARAAMYQKMADENRALYEREHKELSDYREYVHEKDQKATAVNLSLHNQIDQLQSRPDFTDLFKHLEEQALVQTQILQAVQGMVAMMSKLLETKHPS